MRDKDVITKAGIEAAGSITPEVIQIEVMTDIRDQLKRIADVLEYAKEALLHWERSPA